MIVAAIPWLSISINLLLVVFVIVCLLMTLLILMQRPKQEGLGAAFGGGVTDQVFGARTTNVLQKGTVYCGTLFFVIALLLAILIGHQNKDSTLLKEDKPVAEEPATPDDDATPGADTDGGDMPSSLLEELPDEQPSPGADQEAPTGATEQPGEAPDTGGDADTSDAAEPAEETNSTDSTESNAPTEDSSEETDQP